MTSASELAKKYNLGDPEFGNFYQAQYDAYVDVLKAETTEWIYHITLKWSYLKYSVLTYYLSKIM